MRSYRDNLICYDKLWGILKERKISNKMLFKNTGVSLPSLSKMKHGGAVNLVILIPICDWLNVNLTDIVEYVPNNKGV